MPDVTTEQALNLAIQHHQAGRIAEAQAIHRQILAREPNNADALHLLGVIAYQTGRRQEAVKLIQRAIAINPTNAIYHNNLGIALRVMGQFDQAAKAYQESVRLKPDYADAYYNLGITLQSAGKLQEALAAYQSAIHYKPDFPDAYLNLGNTFQELNQNDQAVAVYREAIRIYPKFAELHANLGNLLRYQAKPDEAIAEYHTALKLRPDLTLVYGNLGTALRDQGKLDAAIEAYRTSLKLNPDNHRVHSHLIYTLHFHPGFDDRAIHEEHKRWNAAYAAPLEKFVPSHANDHDPERRLRVGYVSPDFFSQAESFFIMPLLEEHDHERFSIYCYSSATREDFITDRLRRSADVWRDVLNLSDEELARQIRNDQIDILIDLTMHMPQNRLLVFVRKPAPVQVAWLAYPGSTGLVTMDYRLTDALMDQPGVPTPYFSEEAVRLPDCWCCYDPRYDLPPRPAQQEGPICFGSLNNPCKLNDEILNIWSNVLKSVPDSRLLVLSFSKEQEKHNRMTFERAGIDPVRLTFVERSPRTEYLRLYDRIDIVLDPLPYNGITTTLDAMWMGVPVVSLTGNTPAGRAGLSILSTLELPELVARTPQDYLEIVTKLAGDLPRLMELRSTLRERMRASPLMDAKRFARNVEAAYRDMWRKWCGAGFCGIE